MYNLGTYRGWIKVGECPNGCTDETVTWVSHGVPDKYIWCEKCNESLDVQTEENCRDPNFFIDITENELEDGNYHSISGIPTELYNDLSSNFSYSFDKLNIAKSIYKAFRNL